MISHTMNEAAKSPDGLNCESSPALDGLRLKLDANDYLPMLAGYDLSDEQARELLAALWSIMRACVELGISVDVCGELGIDAVPVLSNDPASLDSKDHSS